MSDRAMKLLKVLATHGVPASSEKDYETAIEVIETAFLVSDEQARISAISECLATLEEGITFYEVLIEDYPHSDDLEKKYTAKMDAIKTMRGEINNLMEKEGGNDV